MSIFIVVEEGMTETEAFETAMNQLSERKQRQKAEALTKLDPTKEYTGEVDAYGNPIYNGSIIALFSGCEGYWQVFKGENGQWFKKSISVPEAVSTTEPMMQSMGHGEVIESIEAYEEENWEMFAYLPDECSECVHKKKCHDENFKNCYTGGIDNSMSDEEKMKAAGWSQEDIDLALDFINRAKNRDL